MLLPTQGILHQHEGILLHANHSNPSSWKVGSVPGTGLPALLWGLCPQRLCWGKHSELLACTCCSPAFFPAFRRILPTEKKRRKSTVRQKQTRGKASPSHITAGTLDPHPEHLSCSLNVTRELWHQGLPSSPAWSSASLLQVPLPEALTRPPQMPSFVHGLSRGLNHFLPYSQQHW